jgi:hypothetical protein
VEWIQLSSGGSWEHADEYSGSIKGGEFIDQRLSAYQEELG